MPEIACEACGWMAVSSGYLPDVWAEHVAGCPAEGGAVRYQPPYVPPPYSPPPPVQRCKHVRVRKHVATLASGTKRYAIVCQLCGRHQP